MLYFTTRLISRMDPIKYIFEKLALIGKISLWQMLLSEIDILIKLNFGCTNNVTEYKVCIVGLQVALEFGAYDLSVFGYSLLIISQIEGKWQARDTKLIPYQKCVNRLILKF